MNSLKDRIIGAISSKRDEIVDFTRKLVAIPTENPPGRSYGRCVEAIARGLDGIGIDYDIIEVPDVREDASLLSSRREDSNPRYCLLGFHGDGQRTLYFHGHYDVVPASSEDQFEPSVIEGKLSGRGSSDMKGGLASMIYAVCALVDCGLDLNGRIGLVMVPDEETGGLRGSQYLAETGLLGKDGVGMLTPEPTSGAVWSANRGAISLRVAVKGRPAHVGLHFQGVNAFEKMLVAAKALLELKAEVESRRTSYDIEPEDARRSILLLGGRCEGGTNFNVVPGACSFTVDRRINPEENLEDEKRRLLSLLHGLRREGIDLEVEILQEGNSAGCSQDDPLARALALSVEELTGEPPCFEMCPGLLEIRFYDRRDIPAFAYGPGILSVSHGPDEFVLIDDICRCAAIYALTAVQFLGSRWGSGPRESRHPGASASLEP